MKTKNLVLVWFFLTLVFQKAFADDQVKVQVLEITPSSQATKNATSEVSLCINALNTGDSNAIVEVAKPPSIKMNDASSVLENKADLYQTCEETAIKQEKIVLVKQELRQFKLKFIIAGNGLSEVNGKLYFNESIILSKYTRNFEVPFIVPARVSLWNFKTFGTYFWGSVPMQIVILISLLVFITLFFGFSLSRLSILRTSFEASFLWNIGNSIVSNLATGGALLNLAGILQLFNETYQPSLLTVQQYGILTIIFASFTLLVAVILAIATKGGRIKQMNLITYFLINSIIMFGITGQLILLIYFLIEVYQLVWISGIIFIVGFLIVLILFSTLIWYTITKTLKDTTEVLSTAAPKKVSLL